MERRTTRARDERERLAVSLAAALPDSGGGYELSAAFSSSERKRFLGPWTVAEHTVDGRPYVEDFAASALRGATLIDPAYGALYDFRDAICVKRLRIDGLVETPEGRMEYAYSMGLAISWELGPGCLFARPELGYQATSLGGRPAAVRELAAGGERIRIAYRFEGESLVLEEGGDCKRLERSTE